MLSTITFIIVLSILILVHEFGHFIFAKKFGVNVEAFSLGFGRKLFFIKHKGTEYRISIIPLGGYVKMAGEMPYEETRHGLKDEFMSQPAYKRGLILAAGPALNYILGFLIFAFVFMAGSPQATSRLGAIMDGYPAKEAGLKEGDRIVELNNKPVAYWEEILSVVHNTTKWFISVKIKRQRQEMSFDISPKVKEFKNIFGQQVKLGLLGIMPSEEIEYVRYNPGRAVYLAARKTWDLTWMTCLALWRMATGAMSLKESVTGPIGIFMVTSKAAAAGITYVLGLMAVLSISLAIFNLLPIPVLDGGHILFLFIEKIRGRVVSEKVYERVNQLGVAFLVVLMAFVFYNDAARVGLVEEVSVIARRLPKAADEAISNARRLLRSPFGLPRNDEKQR